MDKMSPSRAARRALTNRIRGIWRGNKSRIKFRASGARAGLPAHALQGGPAGRKDREGNSMSDFDRNYAAPRRSVGMDRTIAIDEGLRAYMIRVYNYMAAGVALTGVVAWLTFNSAAVVDSAGRLVGLTPFGQMLYSGPASIVLFLATLGLVFLISFRIGSLTPSTAFTLFMVYAALLGLMLSSIFLTYTHTSIARVFFISAASFGALSLYGYTTQRNLSPIGSFLWMGLIGLLIAMLVNLFLQSPMFQFVISAAGVLIFAGLTAWDTQRIKEMYDPQEDGTIVGRKAVMGALKLYLDFINIFIFLLQLFGDRR
jgi:FtsH-binding integral membrane protein